MRVIAGKFRGRRLKGPAHPGLRPTSARVRKALFDIIGPRVTGARILDLFAGTGSLGIEALSRGAASVAFVECDRRAVMLLRANLAALGLGAAETEVIRAPVAEALPRLAALGDRYNLVLADPPYETGLVNRTLAALVDGRHLAPGGLVVIEHRAGEDLTAPPGMMLLDRRRYGDTGLSFLVLKKA